MRTVVFWGAGATASLKISTTDKQACFLRALAPGIENTQHLEYRVRKALNGASERWVSAFCDLLKILGDCDEVSTDPLSSEVILKEQIDAMRRNWTDSKEDAPLRSRIVELRRLYDWPALVAAINVCPRSSPNGDTKSGSDAVSGSFRPVDLFNLLDMHLQSGHGFPDRSTRKFLSPQRVLGARGALVMLIQALIYVDWHERARTHPDLRLHEEFALEMGRRMQRDGLRFAADASEADYELDEFIVDDVSVVSLNWDPIGLWAQMVANRTLNKSSSVPNVGNPVCRLQLYHDLGYFVAGPRVEKDHKGSKVWQPMNISSARQLNDGTHGADLRIRVRKHLFAHGCLWWRECPNCGKLSSYLGDTWKIDSESLLPPPPLKSFVDAGQFEPWQHEKNEEQEAWDRGEADARTCVHCHTMTYAHHTPLIMQTNLKAAPPPFLDEIQREMRVVVQDAKHVILAGYTLPLDDVTYRAFLAARISPTEVDNNSSEPPVRCSVVGLDEEFGSQWLYPEELATQDRLPDAVKKAREIFGPENVRYFGGGIPNVFLDGGDTVSERAVDKLLDWRR